LGSDDRDGSSFVAERSDKERALALRLLGILEGEKESANPKRLRGRRQRNIIAENASIVNGQVG
jgi:hypothetical protein